MLKGISDINFPKNFGDKNIGYTVRGYSASLLAKINSEDGLNFSPAIKVLRKHNFILKKLKQKGEKSYSIEFEFDGVIFYSELLLEKLAINPELVYDVQLASEEFKTVSTLVVKTRLGEISKDKENLSAVKFFLDRVESLNIEAELNIQNTRALSNLLDGIYLKILEEFKFINTVVIVFCENIFESKLITKTNENFDNDFIVVEKVKPVYE